MENPISKFTGTWHIVEMEMWSEDYFNTEVQAYVEVRSNGLGYLHFGLVQGNIDGEVEQIGNQERFLYSFEGRDEMDPASAAGWLRLEDENTLTGKFKFHRGDSSTFVARRAS